MVHPADVIHVPPLRPFDVPAPPSRLVLPGEVTRFDEQPLSTSRCFLCGRHLVPKATKEPNAPKRVTEETEEHVFPKWLQHKHNLWDLSVTLLNNTPMKYRQIRIPCCLGCNTISLSQLETRVEAAFNDGYEGVSRMHPYDLFLWLAKLSYGLLFQELFLPASRPRPEAGTIASPAYLRMFKLQHVLLQGAFRRVLPYAYPASVYLFKTQVNEGPRSNFDFADNYIGPFLGLRSDDVGIIAILQDWGASRRVQWRTFDAADPAQPLTAFQFKEVMAAAMTQAARLRWRPRIEYGETRSAIHVRPKSSFTWPHDLFAPYRHSLYVEALSRTTGLPPELLSPNDSEIMTWL